MVIGVKVSVFLTGEFKVGCWIVVSDVFAGFDVAGLRVGRFDAGILDLDGWLLVGFSDSAVITGFKVGWIDGSAVVVAVGVDVGLRVGWFVTGILEGCRLLLVVVGLSVLITGCCDFVGSIF